MTFRHTTSDVAMCNRALSLLAQGPITSVDPPQPNGAPSRECKAWYKPTVARLLESHHWGLATKRAEPAQMASDRAEWLYAFARPDDMAFPVGFTAYGSGTGLSYYQGLGGLIATRNGRQMFLLSGSTLYSNLSGALDYVSFDITEADFTEALEHIVVLSLAAALAMPLLKNQKLQKEYAGQAQQAMNLALTQNLNAGNPRYGDEPSDRDRARGTWGEPLGSSWDWWPGLRW